MIYPFRPPSLINLPITLKKVVSEKKYVFNVLKKEMYLIFVGELVRGYCRI